MALIVLFKELFTYCLDILDSKKIQHSLLPVLSISVIDKFVNKAILSHVSQSATKKYILESILYAVYGSHLPYTAQLPF